MAIQDEAGPVLVTVLCDDCETVITRDYLVPAGTDSLDVARRVMATVDGWMIAHQEDICPSCWLILVRDEPEMTRKIKATQRKWDQ